MYRQVGERLRNAASREIGRRGNDEARRRRQQAGAKRRVGERSQAQREIGTLGNEIVRTIGDAQLDLELRMLVEEGARRVR
jgi:hypothetical protein